MFLTRYPLVINQIETLYLSPIYRATYTGEEDAGTAAGTPGVGGILCAGDIPHHLCSSGGCLIHS